MEISTETPPDVANMCGDARPEIERGYDRVRHEFRCEVLQPHHRRWSQWGGRARRTTHRSRRGGRRRAGLRLPHRRSRLCLPRMSLPHSPARHLVHSALPSSPSRAVSRRGGDSDSDAAELRRKTEDHEADKETVLSLDHLIGTQR